MPLCLIFSCFYVSFLRSYVSFLCFCLIICLCLISCFCLIFCVFMFHFCFMFKFSVFMFHSCSYDHTMHYCSDSQPYHLHVPIVLKSGSLNLLEPLGPVQNCNGIALPLHYTLYYNRESRENSVPPTANLTSSR